MLKDTQNYDFPCRFGSIQFVEIEPCNLETQPSKRMHFDQIKNIIAAMNNKESSIPYKYSTIGKLISKNFRENCSRIIFGDFKGIGLNLQENLGKFRSFIKIIQELHPEFNEGLIMNSNLHLGKSMHSFAKK